jgi:hypothetical protein
MTGMIKDKSSMKRFARHVAATILALGLSPLASATSYSADYTDLWYFDPAEGESGWGVNLIQQNEILFVTLFVYGTDGTPRWYVGSNVSATGQTTFSGPLYSVVGTYFGSPWVASAVGVTPVGNIAFTFSSTTEGSMTYNVNNVVVTKPIIRQTWRADVLTGNYLGGQAAFGAGCGGNGDRSINGFLTVNHTNPTVTMFIDFTTVAGQNARCNYNGTYSQVGSLGSITNGTFSCTVAGTTQNSGTFSMSEIRTSRNGFNGRYAAQDQFCSYAGQFGGIKDVF